MNGIPSLVIGDDYHNVRLLLFGCKSYVRYLSESGKNQEEGRFVYIAQCINYLDTNI